MSDEFGGIPVEEPNTDEFGGVAIAEPPPQPASTAQYVAGGGPMAGMAMIPSPAPSPTASYIPPTPALEGTAIAKRMGFDPEGYASKFIQGAVAPINVGKSFVEGAVSPLGVGVSALGPIPKLAQSAIAAGFGIPAFKEGVQRVYRGTALGEPQEALEGALQALTGGLMTSGAVKGALAKELPREAVAPTEPLAPAPRAQLLLERGAIPMADKPAARSLTEIEQQFRDAKIAEEEARIAALQGQKRASQSAPVVIGEQPVEAQVIPTPSQSIINLARRGALKLQFDQMQRDFEAAQLAGDGPEMARLQKEMLDVQRQLHPLELEREQLSDQFEGEGTWPPTSEQLGTFQSKGKSIPSKFTGGPGEEALPSAEKPPTTKIEVTKSQKAPGIISGTAAERWADDLLRGGGTHAGPDVLAAYAVKGAAVIERGIRNFAEWSSEMVKQFGEDIKPHLRNLYNQSISLWQRSLDQPSEKKPSADVAGKATPSEAPVSSARTSAVTAADVPQAIREPNVTSPVTQGVKWATATESKGETPTKPTGQVRAVFDKVTPQVNSVVQFLRDLTSEEGALTKLTDYSKAALKWSGTLQKSFMEAAEAQKEIATKVPDPVRREGITNWIQADGDTAVLASRAAATVDPKLKAGYEAALNLTPDEIAVANDVKNAYNALGLRGQFYDVLHHFKENYVTQIWNLKKGPVVGGPRTLRDKFRFDKASTFKNYFEGEQAGYVPKTKDISKILPVYLHEMNAVIANRQLAERLMNGRASDGSPLAVKLAQQIPGVNTSNYKSLPSQPALAGWKFHPEAYGRLKSVLGRSAIREWYQTRTSAAAEVPKVLVKGLDNWNGETKRTMLGLLAPFHQVQEGTHAVGHRVSPFMNIPKVDLVRNVAQQDAANHGLMLAPDRVSAEQFMEGFRTSGLVSKIPKIGPLADHYSNYLFHEYIPGLKYKTYEAILGRNSHVYARELASGEVTLSDVKHLSAEQANAAYGHLNYVDLARNPTIQHIMQLGVLAPDFLEARARFAGQAIKGIGGAKVGREQFLALATLAIAQATTAYTSAQLTGGEWDAKRPFEFHVGNRRFSMRSVPEDISGLINDTHTFINSRISPIIGKGLLQYLGGRDWRGQKITAAQTTKELLQQPIPISIRGFLGLGRQSLSGWEQLASAVGLRISRYSPSNDVFDMAHEWMKANPDPKIQKKLEIQQASVFPESEYKPLRNALNDDNTKAAKEAYAELLKTKTPRQVATALSHPHPFTGSAATDRQFRNSLTPEMRRRYDEAVEERKQQYQKFQATVRRP